MESTKCENNTIEHNKHVLNLIIKEFRELIGLCRFKTDKKNVKILRKAIRNREKIVYDEEEDDIEYIKDNINELKNLKEILILTEINIMATGLNILALMKLISICSKMIKKITTYTKLINNISHFLTRLYYHLMNI